MFFNLTYLSSHKQNYKTITQILKMSMLSHTNKSEKRKTNKLPKLTIQQQIDNNQVIERMNRKITFTKNQRYLTTPLQYSDALQTITNANMFRVQPEQLFFNVFQTNRIYESELKLVNKSRTIQRIKIAPLSNKLFVISSVKYPTQNSGDIAPGMQVSIFIRFKPTNLHDSEDELSVIVADGVLKVPIIARRQACKGQWPKEVSCGHCWVGDKKGKQVQIVNSGGDALYSIKGKGQIQGDSYKIGPFKIWPRQLKVQKGRNNYLNLQFTPSVQGLFQQKVTYSSNQGNQENITILLKGGAYSAKISLQEINNQKLANVKFDNTVYLNNCEMGKKSTSSFSIRNHAVVSVQYQWHFDDDPNFTIVSQKGIIQASGLQNFTISYQPSDRSPKCINGFMYLHNLPKQSILNNPETKIINGVEMIKCLKVQVKVSSTQSDVQVLPLHKRVIDKLYLGKQKKTNFTVKNNTSQDRVFWVQTVKNDKFCESSCLIADKRTVKAHSEQQIQVNFKIINLTKQVQYAYYLINFDNSASKLVSVEGKVQYPDLQLYTTQIDFDLLKTNSTYRKKIKVVNSGENQVFFKIQNSHRYYNLNFYDFYEFQNENFYKNRLRIISQGKQCDDWISVKEFSQKEIQFQLNTKDEQQLISLDLCMKVKDGNQYNLKVTGEVEFADAKISHNFIPLKEIFQGNVYHSKKFLPKQLGITNIGNIPIRYEIQSNQIQHCSINIDNLSGNIQPKHKQVIDLSLEPLKTGTFSTVFTIKYYDDIPLHENEYKTGEEILQQIIEDRKNLIKTQTFTIQGRIRGIQTVYYLKDETKAKKISQKVSTTDDAHLSAKMSSYSRSSAQRSYYLDSYKIIYPILQQLNFYNCEINKVQQMQIIIQNNSDLVAEFSICSQNYGPEQKRLKQSKTKDKGFGTQQQPMFTSEMGRTYIQNRSLNQAQKTYLSNNKGISIMCQPFKGAINKKQSQKITITMFNDASGRFKDSLIISIKDHQIKKVPINIQIKGTPVSLSRNQLGINFNNEVPSLNAGTFLTDSGNSSRNIKIINNGPREVSLTWQIYPYGQQQMQNDLFKIKVQEADPSSGKLVDIFWEAIKPEPLLNSPFSISPVNKLLKGREQCNFVLNIKQSNVAQSLQALIIGQPSMLDSQSSIEELAIVVTADFQKPVLKIDQKHNNHIQKMQKFANPDEEQNTKNGNFHRKIKLKNSKKCNISFSVQIQSQKNRQNFQIVSVSTNSPLQKLYSSKGLDKTAKTVVNLDQQYTLPYQSYIQVGINLKGNLKNLEEWPIETKTRKDANLNILFSNGEKQSIPLVGWLYRPELFIQMHNGKQFSLQNFLIDFGTVHISNYCKKSIYLANVTKSCAKWSITYAKYLQTKKISYQKQLWTELDYEDQKITDDKKCFRLNAESGKVLSESIPIHYIPGTLALNNVDDQYATNHRPFRLDIVFKPEANVLYKSKFIIQVENGPSYEIVVRGSGTFAEEAAIK